MAGAAAPRRKTLNRKGIRKALDEAGRQKMIEGTEPPKIESIENAAEKYVEVRDERMSLTKDETAAKEKLLKAMKDEGLNEYSFRGYMVEVTHVEAEDEIKVKKIRAAQEDGSLA